MVFELKSWRNFNKLSFYIAEYKTLCPGGEGFRPNPITVILEGKCVCVLGGCLSVLAVSICVYIRSILVAPMTVDC